MSILTVAKKDSMARRRSRTLWGGAVVLGLIAVLLAYANQGTRQTDLEAARTTFHFLTVVLSLLLPIFALVASYLAIAGERESGGIKFLLSMPNTRRDVYLGKLSSRLGIVAAGVCLMFVAATSVALTKHGAFPATMVFGTLLLTLVYGSVFVSIAVAVSASVASRSSAIGRSLGAYFLLVLLYLFPVIKISSILEAFHTRLLGQEANPDLYNAVEYTSPYIAYQKATNLVVPTGLDQRLFEDSASTAGETSGQTAGGSSASGGGATAGGDAGGAAASAAPDLPVYLTDEFSLVILAVWLLVPLVLGYRAFKGADLE